MPDTVLKLALVQMTSTDERARNLDRAELFVLEAARAGARLVALPENFAFLRSGAGPAPWSEPLDGEIVTRFGRVARDHGIWLLLGSIPEESESGAKVYNTSALLRPDGTLASAYRKVHLFDADVPGAGSFRESEAVLAGEESITAVMPWGRIGITICYDLRFPELYRRLAFEGASLILVPSAFTQATGPAHWEPLLRARAIENQCFIAAPAQAGRHSATRASHGHSMVVDPWGVVLAEKSDGEGVLLAELDASRLQQVRRQLPSLDHARDWLVGSRRRARDE